MRLFAPPGVFSPLSDTWMLAERLRAEPALRGGAALDLCAGSGALAISAALAGAGSTTAVDASLRAVLAARLNERLGLLRPGEREEDVLVLRGLAPACAG